MDPADPERPPTAEGGASGAEKGKKRDEIASISGNEPSGGTQVETGGLKGGGVEHDDGDGGDASPESASPSSRSSTGGSGRNGRSTVSAAALVGGSASGSETLTEPAGGPHAGLSSTPAPPQASGSADAGLQLQLQPAAQQHAPSLSEESCGPGATACSTATRCQCGCTRRCCRAFDAVAGIEIREPGFHR